MIRCRLRIAILHKNLRIGPKIFLKKVRKNNEEEDDDGRKKKNGKYLKTEDRRTFRIRDAARIGSILCISIWSRCEDQSLDQIQQRVHLNLREISHELSKLTIVNEL